MPLCAGISARMAKYVLTVEAEFDIERIAYFGIDRFGELQARDYNALLFRQFARIASAPLRYPSAADIRPGYRRSVVGAHSIYFRILEGEVEIVRVLGRQDPFGAM